MEQTANILNICFIALLVLGIVFLAIAVVLFFLFDIKTIYSIRTGRAQAKAVKEMAETNAQTGHLRYVNKKKKKETPAYNPYDAPIAEKTNFENNSSASPQVRQSRSVPNSVEGAEDTNVLSEISENTTVLPTPAGETILDNSSNNTEEILVKTQKNEDGLTSSLNRNQPMQDETVITLDQLHFDVIKKVVSTFTDEIIY